MSYPRFYSESRGCAELCEHFAMEFQFWFVAMVCWEKWKNRELWIHTKISQSNLWKCMWRRQWVLEPNFLCQFSSFYIFWLRGAAVVVWWQAPKLCSRWSSQLGTATWHRRHWHRVHTEPFHRGIQLPQNWRHGHCLSIECGYFLRSKVQQFICTQISKGTSTIVTEREWSAVYSWQKQNEKSSKSDWYIGWILWTSCPIVLWLKILNMNLVFFANHLQNFWKGEGGGVDKQNAPFVVSVIFALLQHCNLPIILSNFIISSIEA